MHAYHPIVSFCLRVLVTDVLVLIIDEYGASKKTISSNGKLVLATKTVLVTIEFTTYMSKKYPFNLRSSCA